MKSITLIGRSLTLVMMTWCAIDADSPANVSKPTSFIDRRDNVETSLRIMSWNVYRGSIFPPNGKREESFKRIVAAVKPDV